MHSVVILLWFVVIVSSALSIKWIIFSLSRWSKDLVIMCEESLRISFIKPQSGAQQHTTCGRLKIKMSYQLMDSHYKDNTVSKPSYLNYWNDIHTKMVFILKRNPDPVPQVIMQNCGLDLGIQLTLGVRMLMVIRYTGLNPMDIRSYLIFKLWI